MPEIDLEPKDYRAKPVKGEPVFVPGAGRRVLVWCTVFALCIGVGVIVQFLFGGIAANFGTWLANAVFPS